jgi:serine/threonine-protein kinase SRPK3
VQQEEEAKKEEEKKKEDNRNGRRRRRTLITGSQPLPSPLNTSFSSFDFKHSSSNSHSSLSQMVNDPSEWKPFQRVHGSFD